MCLQCVGVCSILQQQFYTTDTPRGTTVVQRSDAINGSSVHLDTHTHNNVSNTPQSLQQQQLFTDRAHLFYGVPTLIIMVVIRLLTLAPAFINALTQATCPDRQASWRGVT